MMEFFCLGYEDEHDCQRDGKLLQEKGHQPVGQLASVPGVTETSKALPEDNISFAGRWDMDLEASDSLRQVLGSLGVSWLLANVIDWLAVTQVIQQDGDGLTITVKTSLGSSTFVLPFDGTVTEIPGATGGLNAQTTRWMAASKEDDGASRCLLTRQAVTGSLNSQDAVVFLTRRSLLDNGNSLYEDVSVLQSGREVAKARRVLRRT